MTVSTKEPTMTTHQAVREILDAAGSSLVSVRFIKKDGTERSLTFNPRDFAEIKGTGKKCEDENIFRVRDIRLGQWRSFDARRVISVSASGKLNEFESEEE